MILSKSAVEKEKEKVFYIKSETREVCWVILVVFCPGVVF